MNVRLGRHGRLRACPALWLLLLAPLLAVLPPVPIDETRYLSIAWEMRQTGSWITLHLNGLPYTDKTPLLFWLINLGWSVFGVSLWAARLMVLLCGVGCIELCRRLERQLAPESTGQAAWLLLGSLFFILFSSVVMFDIPLCMGVLLGFLGMAVYVRGGRGSGLVLLLAGSAVGVLAKGPPALLHLVFPLLAARWWSASAPPSRRKMALMVLMILLGVLPALLWWVLATTAHLDIGRALDLLLHQTSGRMVKSFAHNRPFWWYLPLLPVLLLPWPVLLRWRALAESTAKLATPAARFGLSATLPVLIAFCLISGKQVHYLLPLLPGVALLLGAWSRQYPRLWPPGRLWIIVALFAALWLWTLLDNRAWRSAGVDGSMATWLRLAPAGCIALAAIGILVTRKIRAECRTALVMLFLGMAALPIARLQGLSQLDVRGIAQHIQTLRTQGIPVARTANEPGLVTFLARLPAPLPTADNALLWAQQHPDGYVLVYAGSGSARAGVENTVKLADGWVGLVSARAALADPALLERSR